MLYVKGASLWHIQKKGTWMWCGRKVELTETTYLTPLEVFMCSQCIKSSEGFL